MILSMIQPLVKSSWKHILVIVLFMLFYIVSQFDSLPKTIKILLLIVPIAVHIWVYRPTKHYQTFDKFQYGAAVVSLIFIWLVYLAGLLGDTQISIMFFMILAGIVVGMAIVTSGRDLFKSKTIWKIAISYLSLTTVIIMLFGVVYIYLGSNGNGLIWESGLATNQNVVDKWAYYFSAQVYYSNTLGDILPYGHSRYVIIAESIVSAIFHIIILGFVISTLSQRKVKGDTTK